jgi:hypothetical protein
MARARNIKPGFFRNADLVELSFEERLLFIGLWTIADREGRLEDRPKQIKMELFPADSVDCDAMLDSLTAIGMVARYEVDGKRYLQVINFAKHQNPHRDEKASTLPDQHGHVSDTKPTSNKHCANTVQTLCKEDATTVAIVLNPDPRSLNPDPLTPHAPKGDDRFETFWLAYPKKVGKDAARKAFDKRKVDVELLATMLAAISAQTKSAMWAKDAGQYIPYPATWLNEGRWMDGGVTIKPTEDWFVRAGFDNVHEARNMGCSPSTAHLFHDGQKVEVAN